MSNSYEKLENGMVKVRMEIAEADFEKACERAYNKQKGKISIPGFRQGKAPRNMIEKLYGKDVFYEDAINSLLPEAYEAAITELELDVMSYPTNIDVEPVLAGAPVAVTAEVAVRPEVKLCKYRAMKVAKEEVEVTAEDIEAELKKNANKNSRQVSVDRAAELDDTANIDYEGFVDGVAFEGGKDTSYDLKLGSGSFIPGFEEQVVGHKAGEEFDINVTFPEEYHAEDLAGKPAVFKIKLNSVTVTELPELDDDYAKDFTEFETLDEYKASLKEEILSKKQEEADSKRFEAIIDKMIDKCEVQLSDAIITTRAEQMIDEMAQNLQYQGLSIEQYMQYMGTDRNGLREQMKENAEKNVRTDLIVDAVMKAEGVEVTEEDMEDFYTDLAKQYNMEAAKIKEYMAGQEDQIKKDLGRRKTAKLLNEAVKF